jgi:DNA-binding transcriptional LysR family regulator
MNLLKSAFTCAAVSVPYIKRMPLMDMHRLAVFCKVVELQSFTKAGEEMFLSQPTISEHIRSLEEMLGEKLLDRLGKDIFPTPVGKILYGYAQQILQLREEAIQEVARFKGELAGRLILGASLDPGTYFLPKTVGSFKASYPSIQIAIKILGITEIVEAVLKGNLEVGLIGSKWKDNRFELEEIFSDELALIVFPEHPWRGRDEILMEEIYGEPFILRERGSGVRMVMEQILESHDFDFSKLSVVAEMASTEAIRQSLRARLGISIISKLAIAEDLERSSLFTVSLKGIQFIRPFYLIHRKKRHLSPICSAFLNHLRAMRGRTNSGEKAQKTFIKAFYQSPCLLKGTKR